MPWTGSRGIIGRIVNPSPTVQANPQVAKVLQMLQSGSCIVDLGAGGRKITPDTITVDFVPVEHTSVIADIHDVPLQGETVDCVFCTGTLEHTENPERVVREIKRILNKGGVAYIDVPFMQCYHPDPVDYWRFTVKGLELLCVRNGIEKAETGVNIGSASTLTWVLMAFFESVLPENFVGRSLARILKVAVSPLKYIDYLSKKGREDIGSACAVYFIGRKS